MPPIQDNYEVWKLSTSKWLPDSFRNGVGWPRIPFQSSLFLRILFTHFSHTTFSINNRQFLLSFAPVLHSSPTLPMPLLMQSSHRNLDLPLLLCPSTFWYLHCFILKVFSTLRPYYHSSLISSFYYHDTSSPVVFSQTFSSLVISLC